MRFIWWKWRAKQSKISNKKKPFFGWENPLSMPHNGHNDWISWLRINQPFDRHPSQFNSIWQIWWKPTIWWNRPNVCVQRRIVCFTFILVHLLTTHIRCHNGGAHISVAVVVVVSDCFICADWWRTMYVRSMMWFRNRPTPTPKCQLLFSLLWSFTCFIALTLLMIYEKQIVTVIYFASLCWIGWPSWRKWGRCFV